MTSSVSSSSPIPPLAPPVIADPTYLREKRHLYDFICKRETSDYRPALSQQRDRINSSRLWVSRLSLSHILYHHQGCVNTVNWSKNGQFLISSGDDQIIDVWTLGSFEKPKFSLETLHRHNVFDVSFVPQSNDSKCISCSADGKARAFFYLSKGGETKKTDKQGVVQLGNFETGSSQLVIRGTHESFKCRFFPESASTVFTTWSHGTITRSDLRDGSNETILQPTNRRIFVATFDPKNPYILAVGQDKYITMFDIRRSLSMELTRFCKHEMISPREVFISDIEYSSDNHLLVNYASEDVCLFSLDSSQHGSISVSTDFGGAKYVRSYSGRENSATFLKQATLINNEEYIATGCDSGRIFIWDRSTGEVVRKLGGDSKIVNSLVSHPYLSMLASSGIDSSIKIWSLSDTEEELLTVLEESINLCHSSSFHFSDEGVVVLIKRSDQEKRLQKASQFVDRGRRLYHSGEFSQARKAFNASQKELSFFPTCFSVHSQRLQIFVRLQRSLAALFLEMEDFQHVVAYSTKVLDHIPQDKKSLLRIIAALMQLKQFQKASNYLVKASTFFPDDKSFEELRQQLENRKEEVGVEEDPEPEFFQNDHVAIFERLIRFIRRQNLYPLPNPRDDDSSTAITREDEDDDDDDDDDDDEEGAEDDEEEEGAEEEEEDDDNDDDDDDDAHEDGDGSNCSSGS